MPKRTRSRSSRQRRRLPRLLKAAWSSAVLLAAGLAPLAWAHDPITTKITWTREISRMVERRCLDCHGAGSVVPLTSYPQARPWAKAIRDQVLSRQMPPWGAVRGVGDFLDDRSLSQPELDLFVSWVEGGAPEGEAKDMPSMQPPTMKREPRFRPLLTVSAGLPVTLTSPVTVAAYRPDNPLALSAALPDGAIRQLLWVRDVHGLTYRLREPLALPEGTVLRVTSGTCRLGG